MTELQPDWLEWRYDGHRHYIVQRPEIGFISWEEAQDYCDEHNRALVGQAVIREREKTTQWLKSLATPENGFLPRTLANWIEDGMHYEDHQI